MKLRRKKGLLALALGAGMVAQASTWVPVASRDSTMFIPLPGLEGVSVDPFQYGDTADITLKGFGVTDTVYFQKQTWFKRQLHNRRVGMPQPGTHDPQRKPAQSAHVGIGPLQDQCCRSDW